MSENSYIDSDFDQSEIEESWNKASKLEKKAAIKASYRFVRQAERKGIIGWQPSSDTKH